MGRRFKQAKEPKGPRLIDVNETEYGESILKLAAKTIEEEHEGLAEAKITYWFVADMKHAGEAIDADLQLVTGLNRKESGTIFRVLLNKKTWETATAEYRAYILDNQLERCGKGETKNGEVRWYKRDYSVKVFPGIIRRHGLMTAEVKQLDKAMHQIELDFDAKMDATNEETASHNPAA